MDDDPARDDGLLDLGGEALQEKASPSKSSRVLGVRMDVRGGRLDGGEESWVRVEDEGRPLSRMRHVTERNAPAWGEEGW